MQGKQSMLRALFTSDENVDDKLAKIRQFVTFNERKFPEIYITNKNFSIVETLVKYNGRLSFKLYMKAKLIKLGIKVLLLADADTYFVPQFQVHLGKVSEESHLSETRDCRPSNL